MGLVYRIEPLESRSALIVCGKSDRPFQGLHFHVIPGPLCKFKIENTQHRQETIHADAKMEELCLELIAAFRRPPSAIRLPQVLPPTSNGCKCQNLEDLQFRFDFRRNEHKTPRLSCRVELT